MESPFGFHERACGLLIAAALLSGITGCYEVPPVIPPGYVGSPPSPGWPPLCVYDLDAFSLRNRWFHRQISARASEGEIIRAHADEPFGRLVSPSPVDVAEIVALLRALAATPQPEPEPGDPIAFVSAAIFRSDLLAEACRIEVDWPASEPREEIRNLSRQGAACSSFALPSSSLEPSLRPTPLRTGDWKEVPAPAAPGLVASPADPRATKLFRMGAPARASVLVRYRAAARKEGGLGPLPIASECWELERGDDGPTYRVFRFDRAEWLQGRDPWRVVQDEVEIVIRNPVDPSQRLEGAPRRLCASCHCGE